MTELYTNVRDEVKTAAECAWKVAIAMKNPVDSATFLDNVTNFFKSQYTEEEIEFLQFYFNMQMELMK